MGYKVEVEVEDGITSICKAPETPQVVGGGADGASGSDHASSTEDVEKPRECVHGEARIVGMQAVADDEFTALAGWGSYVAFGATEDEAQSFCYREAQRRQASRLTRLRAMEAARTRVEGPGL